MVIGNIIGLLASIAMVISGIVLSKKKILLVEIIEVGLFTLADLIMGGVSGALVNFMNLISCILCYKDKLTLLAKILITIATVTISILFNEPSIFGIILIISMLIYLWCLDLKDVVLFKCVLIFGMTIWCIYDISIRLYSAAVFDFLTVMMNVISVMHIERQKKSEEKREIYG